MLKKRLGAAVFVKDGLVVQSVGFSRYLPIGKPEVVIKNLDDWGADEIILLNQNSVKSNKPNYELIEKVSDLSIRTPLTYGGGIKDAKDAIKCIKHGADRVVINQIYLDKIDQISNISKMVGKESLVLSLNVTFNQNKLFIYNYLSKQKIKFNEEEFQENYNKYISEIFLTDYINEGKKNAFNFNLLKHKLFKNKKIISYGGINSINQLRRLFRYKNVSSVILGNFLNYKESSIFNIKKECKYGFRK